MIIWQILTSDNANKDEVKKSEAARDSSNLSHDKLHDSLYLTCRAGQLKLKYI